MTQPRTAAPAKPAHDTPTHDSPASDPGRPSDPVIENLLTAGVTLDGVPKGARVVVAMSGGVDSSVVAALCARAGYDTVGVTLQLYDHGAAIEKKGACCAGQDIHDARRVAEAMGFPHYVLDYESRFRDQVMEDFADSYLAGETPIPCVRCNQTVKFADLLSTARDLGAECLVTGHYIQRLVDSAGQAQLHRAVDADKDQSYFLFATTQDQLDFLRFPLGGLEKSQTRALAEGLGLAVADKPDSQDICFVPDGKYFDVVQKIRPGSGRPGDIVHVDGRVLGEHPGVIHYTIGQRRGLNVAVGEPLYVVKLDPAKRHVIVGPREALGVSTIDLKEVNWLGPVANTPTHIGPAAHSPMPDALTSQPVWVKVRSTRPPVPARFSVGEGGSWSVALDTPEQGVAPGQACVFYDPASEGARVLGGGWIAKTR